MVLNIFWKINILVGGYSDKGCKTCPRIWSIEFEICSQAVWNFLFHYQREMDLIMCKLNLNCADKTCS